MDTTPVTRSPHRDDIHDAPLQGAVRAAARAAAEGDEQALAILDRRMRRSLLRWTRGADDDLDELLDAVQAALDVARDAGQRAWLPRWKYLIEIAVQARETAAVDAQVGALARCSSMQQAVLFALDQHGALTNGALSEQLGRKPNQISNLTSALAEMGLVSRVKIGRESYASLTAQGRRLMATQAAPAVVLKAANQADAPSTVAYWGGFRPADVAPPP